MGQGPLDMNLHLANRHSPRHPFFSPHLQTLLDGLLNILLSLLFGLALTHTARDRWTFRDFRKGITEANIASLPAIS